MKLAQVAGAQSSQQYNGGLSVEGVKFAFTLSDVTHHWFVIITISRQFFFHKNNNHNIGEKN